MTEEISSQAPVAEAEEVVKEGEFIPSDASDGQAKITSASQEQPISQSDSSTENWWSTEGLDESLAARIKSAHADYTRTKQEASRVRQEAQQARELQQRLSEYEASIRHTLENPQEYERARQLYFAQTGRTLPTSGGLQMSLPKLGANPTIEELEEYISQKNEHLRKTLQQEYDAKLQTEIQRIAQPLSQDRWSAANRALLNDPMKGEMYQRYSPQVFAEVRKGSYQAMLHEGKTEKQILEAALLQIPGVMDEILGKVKQSTLESVTQKKKAVTEKPGRSPGSKSSSSQTLTREEAIKELIEMGLGVET